MRNWHKKSRVIDTKPKEIVGQDEMPDLDLDEDSGVHHPYFRWALVAVIVICAGLGAWYAYASYSRTSQVRCVIFLYQGKDKSDASGVIESACSNLGGSVNIERNGETIATATNSGFAKAFEIKSGPNVLSLAGTMLATLFTLLLIIAAVALFWLAEASEKKVCTTRYNK